MTAVPRLKSYHFTRHALMNPIKKSHLAALTVAIAAVTVGTALLRQAQANLAGIEERKRLAMIEQDRSKRLLESNEFLAGDEYTIADMPVWPWYPSSLYGVYGTHEFLAVEQYTHLLRWHETLAARPAVARGRVVNRTSGAPGENLRERHDASDFDSLTQEKI